MYCHLLDLLVNNSGEQLEKLMATSDVSKLHKTTKLLLYMLIVNDQMMMVGYVMKFSKQPGTLRLEDGSRKKVSYFLKDLLVALKLLVQEFVSIWLWLIIHLRETVLPYSKGLSYLFV